MLTAPQVEILQGAGVVAVLGKLTISPSEILRLSTLGFDWTDGDGATWLGGRGHLDFGAAVSVSNSESAAMSVVWSGATPELIAAALGGEVLGKRFERFLAFIDDNGAQVGGLVRDFSGICEAPAIDSGSQSISIAVENDVITLGRGNVFRYTADRIRRETPGDTFADYVASLQNKDVFG